MSSVTVSVRCTTGKICPLCGRECIEAWETVCSRCWKFLGKCDRIYGTTYQQQVKDNKKVVIYLPAIIHKIQTCYYPLTREERMQRARKLARKFCKGCQTDVSNGCPKCWIHWLMNEILGNGE